MFIRDFYGPGIYQPCKKIYIFNNVIKALNYKKPDFHNFDPVDVEEMWNGLYIIHKFLPKAEFDGEVLLFIKTVLTEGGIHFLPPFIEESEAYKLIKDKAENGPFPLGDDFIDAQATKLMALDTKHKIESTKDYSWLTYNLT